MSFCKEGDKPKVKYKFNNSTEQRYESNLSPIEIETGRLTKSSQNEDYDAEGFTIVNASGGRATVINYRTRVGPTTGVQQIQFWSCGNDDWDNRQPDGTYPVWYNQDAPIVGIDRTVKCPPPYPGGDCYLRVKHQNSVIYEVRGECPLTFNIQCGNCPPGHIECKCNAYPGYCCIPCSEIRNGIAAATAQLRGING
jgi:hypothetical protein